MSVGEQDPGEGGPPPAEEGPSAAVLLVVTAVLVVGGYFLSVKLAEMGRLQDCVMSGRTNCAPVASPSSGG
ncbi:MAG TPA: hypothetical protein HPP80_10325 [Rhodospirillaceae bacterium]|nr:hypothetical protein [Rhodospirillaceae bacterium]